MPLPTKSKSMCQGCYNDFYNHGGGGAKGCWSFDSAEVCEKVFIHLSWVPPWNAKPEITLSCYKRSKYVKVDPDHPQVQYDEESGVQEVDGGSYG